MRCLTSEEKILEVLRNANYLHHDPKYSNEDKLHVEDKWDCDDRAFVGVAAVRFWLPGCPVGIAVGHSGNVQHAVVVYWFQDNNKKWIHKYFEPWDKKEAVGFNDDKSIIAFPLFRQDFSQESTDSLGMGLLKKFTRVENKSFCYDKGQDFSRFDEIESFLKARNFGKLPEDTTFKDLRKDYYDPEDLLLWVRQEVRRRFIDSPIGVAFGIKNKSPYATLVLWKSADDPRIWDVNRQINGEIKESEFTARAIII